MFPVILSNLNMYHVSLVEVKIKPEHMQGASDGVTVEPMTPEMADKMGNPPKVEVTKSQKDL